jgi:hypothetical protein
MPSSRRSSKRMGFTAMVMLGLAGGFSARARPPKRAAHGERREREPQLLSLAPLSFSPPPLFWAATRRVSGPRARPSAAKGTRAPQYRGRGRFLARARVRRGAPRRSTFFF